MESKIKVFLPGHTSPEHHRTAYTASDQLTRRVQKICSLYLSFYHFPSIPFSPSDLSGVFLPSIEMNKVWE